MPAVITTNKKDRPAQPGSNSRTVPSNTQMGTHMSNSKKSNAERPWWQSTPCPSWCWGHHDDEDGGSDRACWSRWDQHVTLTLFDAEHRWYGEKELVLKPKLVVCLHQQFRELAPRVRVEPEHSREDLPSLELTVAEAERLGKALLRAARIAGGVR